MRNEMIELKIKVQSLEDFIQAKHINKDSIEQNSTSEEADNVQLKKTKKVHQSQAFQVLVASLTW